MPARPPGLARRSGSVVYARLWTANGSANVPKKCTVTYFDLSRDALAHRSSLATTLSAQPGIREPWVRYLQSTSSRAGGSLFSLLRVQAVTTCLPLNLADTLFKHQRSPIVCLASRSRLNERYHTRRRSDHVACQPPNPAGSIDVRPAVSLAPTLQPPTRSY